MSYADNFWSELKTLIVQTWPEMSLTATPSQGGYICRSQSINRADWQNLIEGGALVTPYTVIQMGAFIPETWQMDGESYRVQTSVYYVTRSDDPGSAIGEETFDISAYVANKMLALRTQMFYYGGTGFQLAGNYPTVDCSETNPPNHVFYQSQNSMFGGALHASLLVGQT